MGNYLTNLEDHRRHPRHRVVVLVEVLVVLCSVNVIWEAIAKSGTSGKSCCRRGGNTNRFRTPDWPGARRRLFNEKTVLSTCAITCGHDEDEVRKTESKFVSETLALYTNSLPRALWTQSVSHVRDSSMYATAHLLAASLLRYVLAARPGLMS